MTDEPDDDSAEHPHVPRGGPNVLCHTCGGLRKLSEPRQYVVQATEDMQTGMTMAEWRTCPQCQGRGFLPGIVAPV